jgi:8-oxo-dGTP pyrophosphatase MutT (NUDIX family)
LPTLLQNLKRRLFWIVARTCFTLYRWLPLFGSLRASIAIIRRSQTFLVIQRNDGRGFSLPGGISGRNEAEIDTLHREVLEETGLAVTSEKLRMRYRSTAEVPCHIAVFEVEATGELEDSWEGSPRWMTIPELEPKLMNGQRPVLDLLRKISAEVHQDGDAEKEEKRK